MKKLLFIYTAFANWFIYWNHTLFSVRYELSRYTQRRLISVLRGLRLSEKTLGLAH